MTVQEMSDIIERQGQLAWKEMCDMHRTHGDDSRYFLYIYLTGYTIGTSAEFATSGESALAFAPVGGYECLDDLLATLGDTTPDPS